MPARKEFPVTLESASGSRKEILWSASFIELIALSFITSFSYMSVQTLVSSYAVSYGAELAAAGSAVGAFSISAMIIRPFSGFFSDKLNKKLLLCGTTLLLVVSLAAYCLCHSVPLLFVIRILHGAAFGVNSTVNMALAVEHIPNSRTGEGLGYYGVGQVLAQIAGPPVGVALKGLIGYNALFLGDAAFVLAAAVLFFLFFHYHPGKKQEGERKALFPHTEGKNRIMEILESLIAKECIFYALICGLFSMSNGIVNSFLVILGDQKGIPNISLFFTVCAIVIFLLRILVGKALDRVKLLLIVSISLLTTALSMSLVGLAGGLALILVAAAIKAFGNVGGQISLQSACVKRVDAARVGIATSTYYIGADIGNGFGPVWGGVVADHFGVESAFHAMAGVFVAGCIIFAIYEIRNSRKTPEKPLPSES